MCVPSTCHHRTPAIPWKNRILGYLQPGGAPRASWGLWGDTQGLFPIPVDPWGSRPLPGGFLCTPKVRIELGCSSKRWGGGEESGGGNEPPHRVHRLNLCPKEKLKAWIEKEIKAALSRRCGGGGTSSFRSRGGDSLPPCPWVVLHLICFYFSVKRRGEEG